MRPLRTATPSVLRRASILGHEFQVSDTGSYTSILRTRSEPLNPPTAYTRPFNTANPVDTAQLWQVQEMKLWTQTQSQKTRTLAKTGTCPFIMALAEKPCRKMVHLPQGTSAACIIRLFNTANHAKIIQLWWVRAKTWLCHFTSWKKHVESGPFALKYYCCILWSWDGSLVEHQTHDRKVVSLNFLLQS